MRVKSTMQRLAALIEFVVASGLAAFFHIVLEEKGAALSIFGCGLLLSLATWLLREDIIEMREKMLEDYCEHHELPDVMSKIHDPECIAKAKQIIARVTRNMTLLQRGFIPLDETEFMLEATKAADATTKTLKSVNPLTPGWDTRGAIIKYYQANKRALQRGVKVTRAFVLRREQLLETDVQNMLRTHFEDGFEVRVIYRDDLPACGETGWAKECSFSFGVYDDQIVVDVSSPAPYFGVKTTQPEEVSRYLHLFALVEHASHQVSLRENIIVHG
jgi:hypothetical protein